jgi:hypothetical protein
VKLGAVCKSGVSFHSHYVSAQSNGKKTPQNVAPIPGGPHGTISNDRRALNFSDYHKFRCRKYVWSLAFVCATFHLYPSTFCAKNCLKSQFFAPLPGGEHGTISNDPRSLNFVRLMTNSGTGGKTKRPLSFAFFISVSPFLQNKSNSNFRSNSRRGKYHF